LKKWPGRDNHIKKKRPGREGLKGLNATKNSIARCNFKMGHNFQMIKKNYNITISPTLPYIA